MSTNMSQASRRQAFLSNLASKTTKNGLRPTQRPVQSARLSDGQQRLWYLYQSDPALSCAYDISFAWRISGPLNVAALKNALTVLMQRHDVLRLRIRMSDEAPIQDIAPVTTSLPFRYKQSLEDLDATLAQEKNTPLQLDMEKLWCARLWVNPEQDHVLMIKFSHLISDGVSVTLFQEELAALYDDEEAVIPDVEVQFPAHAQRMEQWQRGPECKEMLEAYSADLTGAHFDLDLPKQVSEKTVGRYSGQRIPLNISGSAVSNVINAATLFGVTPYVYLLACWRLVLGQFAGGQADMVVGIPTANRPYADLSRTLGFFVNTLPIRLQTKSETTVRAYLEEVGDAVAAAVDRQQVPFDVLVNKLGQSGVKRRSPLFQTMFAMSNTAPKLDLNGVETDTIDIPHDYSDHDISIDISLDLTARQPRILGSINYATSLFSSGFVETVLTCFKHTAESLPDFSSQHLADVSVLSPLQLAELHSFNPPALPVPTGSALAGFDKRVAVQPNMIALSDPSGNMSYSDLAEASNALALALAWRGVCKGDKVALQLGRDPAMIVAMIACLRVGAAFVPVDSDYPQARKAMILEDADPAVILCKDASAFGERALQVNSMGQLHDPTMCKPNSLPDVVGDDLAYSIYTSGTTGRPKGVLVSHSNLCALIGGMAMQSKLTADDVVLIFASFSFDAAIEDIFCALSAGSRIVIRPDTVKTPDSSFQAFLMAEGITYIDLPTGFWHCWVQEIAEGRCLPNAPLRCISVGGEKVERQALQTWFETPAVRECPILNAYGPTETTISATTILLTIDNFDRGQHVPIGRPLDGYRCYVVNADGQLCPPGATGELWIAGNGVSQGYANRPDETTAAFLPNPFEAEKGKIYRTGDLAYWIAPGILGYAGRSDAQVKFRGYRIELAEIEKYLSLHKSVHAACVLMHPDAGQGARLVAYVAIIDKLDMDDLRQFAANGLPEFMVPTHFDHVNQWPLTANGKLDKRALLARPLQTPTKVQKEPLTTEAQITVAAIWEDIIGPGPYSPDDDFFMVGGHSLLAIRFIARLRARMGRDLTLADMLRNPTIKSLARLVSAPTSTNLITCMSKKGQGRPIFGIHAIDGDVGYLSRLATALTTSRPLYAIRARGLRPDETPHDDLKAFVDDYVAEIKICQPQGPYTLIGWSAGGTLAWHVGQALMLQGDSVDFLGLIDTCATFVMACSETDVVEAKHPGLATLLDLTRNTGKNSQLIRKAEDMPLGGGPLLLDFCNKKQWLDSDFTWPIVARMQQVRESILSVIRKADPTVDDALGRVSHVFTATDSNRIDPTLGWQDVCADIRLHPIGGTHFSIVVHPVVQLLAAAIESTMDHSMTSPVGKQTE